MPIVIYYVATSSKHNCRTISAPLHKSRSSSLVHICDNYCNTRIKITWVIHSFKIQQKKHSYSIKNVTSNVCKSKKTSMRAHRMMSWA